MVITAIYEQNRFEASSVFPSTESIRVRGLLLKIPPRHKFILAATWGRTPLYSILGLVLHNGMYISDTGNSIF